MSTSLGRLTLDLAADPTQLNRDLDAVKAHALSVAKDIENALKGAFSAAGNFMPSASGGSSVSSNNPFGGLQTNINNFVTNVRNTFNSLKGLNISDLFKNLKSSFQNIPNIARTALIRLPTILKAGVAGLPLVLGAVGLQAGKALGQGVINSAKTGLNGLRQIGQTAGKSFVSAFQSSLSAVSFGAFAAAGANAFNTVTSVISGSIAKVQEFGKGLFETLQEVQTFDARLKTFVQDAGKREELNKRLNSFAATTPFELKDIRESAIKNLSTMADPGKVNLDKYMADLKALGDVAAGAQQPVGELADKFAKARTEGVAHNEDLQEWAGRGIPIYQELGKILGATAAEVKQMASDGKINFDLLNQAVGSMTQQGGVYFNAMGEQAGTLKGKISNISDTFYQFKEQLGKAFEPLFNLGTDIFGEMVKGLSDSKGVMADIKKETQLLADYFKENPEIAKALNKSLQDIVKGAMKGLVAGVKNFAEFLKENPAIIKQIATGISTVTKTIGKAVSFAVDLATTFGGAVVNQINKNQDLIDGIVKTVQDTVKFAIDLASVFGGAVLGALNENNSVTDSMRTLVESLMGLWNENKQVIAEVGRVIGEAIGTTLKICLDLVVGILKYLREHPAIIEAIGLGIKLVAKVFEGIVIAVGKILEGIGWIIGKVTDWANSSVPVQNFFTSVGNAVTGIITGIDGIINKTFDWLKSLQPVQDALNAIAGMGAGGGSVQEGIGAIANAAQNTLGGGGGNGSKFTMALPGAGTNLRSGANQNVPDWIPKMSWEQHKQFLVNQAMAAGITDPNQIKYLLATAEHETGKGMFMREGGSANYLSYLNNKLGNKGNADAVAYRGAGYSQLTGKSNFEKWSPIVSQHFGQEIDLVKNPDLAAHPDIAAFILAKGMKEGSITGRAIGKYVDTKAGKVDFRNARRTINGINSKQLAQIDKVLAGISLEEVQQRMAMAQKQLQQGGGGSAPNWNENGVGSAYGGSGGRVIQNQGYNILGSSGEGQIRNYEQLATHHHNERGGGRRRKGNRTFIQSPTKAQGVLEEARTTGVAGGVHIKKDFVLKDKRGNSKVPSPSPAAGVVQDIFPGVGGVVIGDGKGNRLATSLHMSNIRVKVGQRVSYGQILGTQDGVSGYSVHSHIEMPLEGFRRYIKDLQSGRFGSAPEQASQESSQAPNWDESGVGSQAPAKPSNNSRGGSGGSGSRSDASAPSASRSSSSGSTPKQKVVLQRTGRKDAKGLEILKANVYDAKGQVIGSYETRSGKPNTQGMFGGAGSTKADINAPAEFGKYKIGGETAGSSAAVGSTFIPIDATFGTARSALGFHYDADQGKSGGAGSAGCIVFPDKKSFEDFRKKLRESGAKELEFQSAIGNIQNTNSITKESLPSTQDIAKQAGANSSTSSTTPKASPEALRALKTARDKGKEALYKEISEELSFAQRNQRVETKQKRELEDKEKERTREQAKAKLTLDAAKAETPAAKQVLERRLARFDIDAKHEDEMLKLTREREDLELARANKQKALAEAQKRKEEFIKTKKAAGESYTDADLEKFNVIPTEEAAMDYSKALTQLNKMIESRQTLYDLELQTLGLNESAEDKAKRREESRNREIEAIKRKGQAEIDNLKIMQSSVTDDSVRDQLANQIQQKELEVQAKVNLLPFEHQLEDLNQAMSELTSAGMGKDSQQVKDLQARIDDVNKQKEETARSLGVSSNIAANERQQAETERNRQRESEQQALDNQAKIAEIEEKISQSRSDTEKTTLEFEKSRLELQQQQAEAQKPLLDKLADLQKDRETLISKGDSAEATEALKLLDAEIANINKQLETVKTTSETSLRTLAKESEEAIAAAKRADAGRLIEKEQMLSGADVQQARIEQMKSRNADPYAISAMERESALAAEALRYRQEMLAVEEKIANLKGTNAELTESEANQLRNNAQAIHEINLEGINDNVRTLGKDLREIGKGAVADFFGQLKSGSMDFQSILQGIIDSLWNLGMELIQSQLFGEGGIFGTKKAKKEEDNSGGGLLGGLIGGSQGAGSALGTGAGATPMQPAFVSVVGGAGGIGGLGGMFNGGMGNTGNKSILNSLFTGSIGFNDSNPLPINMVSANKDAFSGLGDMFSGLFGGGGGGGLGGLIGGLFGGGGAASGGGGGGFLGGLLSFLPSIFGFSEGGKVQGLGINRMPPQDNPIANALRAERAASGKKPVLAVLHENELVLNEEQQKRVGIFDVPRFDSGGIVGGMSNNFNKNNETNINMTFNTAEGDTGGVDANALRAVINQEIIRQQGSGGSLGRGSYSRRGR